MVFVTAVDGSEPRLLNVHVLMELLNNGTEAEHDALLESISAAPPDNWNLFGNIKTEVMNVPYC